MRSKSAKSSGQCAQTAPLELLDATPAFHISAVLPQLAKPHSAQDTSRAPQTPWNSATLGCADASGDANSARDAASAVSNSANRGSSIKRAASFVRRPRAERFSFPSL